MAAQDITESVMTDKTGRQLIQALNDIAVSAQSVTMTDQTGQEIKQSIDNIGTSQVELDAKIDKSAIVNDLNQTAAGTVLDGRQGKVLGDAISSLNTKVDTITTGTITLNTTAFYSADYAHYVVKNGICEVSIDFKARNNISSYTNLCTLPKPKVGFYLEVPTVSSYSEPIISVGVSGTVQVSNCSSGKTYFSHFCYIVDDSE